MNLFRAISNILRFDRTNWKALALCFFAAAIFWMFNALNKNYSTNIQFPLQFEFDNVKYIPVDPLPASLLVNVSGNGWELFRNSVGLKVPNIALPLDRPLETHKIVTGVLSPLIASQIGSLTINYIVSDTLRLRIEPRISRKIKLIANLDEVTFKQNYGRTSPVVILPDSISLDGPKSLVEKFNDTLELKLMASRLGNSFRETLEIAIPEVELIKRNPPVVEVLFDVEVVEEMKRRIKLIIPKLPWSIEADRDSVSCVFLFPQNNRERFLSDIENASASIILIDIKKGETKTVQPVILGIPSYAQLVFSDSVKLKKY